MAISPQGYKLGGAPEAQNPFWGEGEDQSVEKIYATASVDNRTGVPGVVTTKHVSGNDITFDFAFHNLKGDKGEKGDTGDTGAVGPEGPRGPVGEPGPQGETGATGATGPQGPVGETGPEGPQGPAGKDGTDGAPGATGPEGPQGPAGVDGVSPTAKVEQTGENEVTITVTDASGTTTAVLSGEQGLQGPVGPEGPQGPQGEKGDTGATGPQGPQGETGPQGPVGPEGPQGPQGEKGDTGATGPQGPQGETGPQGPVGPEGPQGPEGTTGPAGPGVAAGGTVGQVLTKKSGSDYDTEWADPAGGGTEKLIVDTSYLSMFYGISGWTAGSDSFDLYPFVERATSPLTWNDCRQYGIALRDVASVTTAKGAVYKIIKSLLDAGHIIKKMYLNEIALSYNGSSFSFDRSTKQIDIAFGNPFVWSINYYSGQIGVGQLTCLSLSKANDMILTIEYE